ncbi:DUF1329 domain-containing protein [Marinobacterium weihaiense]|nr:DUF1329 domain-containing protein [Marinobacterium weihaiense]
MKYSTLAAAIALHTALLSGTALAAATAEELAELGNSRTCVGSLKAGNDAGTIPEWSGKWQGVPDHVNFEGTGNHPVDPYPQDTPKFVITAQNMAEHADKLSAGQKALFEKYPDTFQMPVYPSRRDFRFPDNVCEVTRQNAQSAKLVNDGEGVEATTGGILFPFPKSGLELLTPGHANPEHMRYELQRVWVLEANLKDDYRHIYGKRHMYIDADTWFMVMADNYDARGGLWRTSMVNYFYAYEAQTWQAGVGFYHDLQAGSYLAFNLINEQPKGYTLNEGDLSDRDFGPQAARRAGL